MLLRQSGHLDHEEAIFSPGTSVESGFGCTRETQASLPVPTPGRSNSRSTAVFLMSVTTFAPHPRSTAVKVGESRAAVSFDAHRA